MKGFSTVLISASTVVAIAVVLAKSVGPSLDIPFFHPSHSSSLLISPPPENDVVAEGRISSCRNAIATVTAMAQGSLLSSPPVEGTFVRKGEILSEIDNADMRARLAGADARLSFAEADYRWSKKQIDRMTRLLIHHATTPSSMDKTEKYYKEAIANKKSAESAILLDRSLLEKSYSLAPLSGQVMARYVDTGDFVSVGTPIALIADPFRYRIVAEVDEFDIGRVRTGNPVRIHIEGESRTWRGTVVSISDRVTRKHLIPEDPGRPTDTGIVAVKIVPIRPLPARIGQKVDLVINVDKKNPVDPESLATHCTSRRIFE